MEEHLCATPITGNYVAEHLKKSIGPHAILKSIKDAKQIAIGQGFVAMILRLELEWEECQENNLPSTVIVKVPTVESLHKLMSTSASVDEAEKAKAMMGQVVIMIHKSECDLYNMLGHKPPIRMPKFYVALPIGEEEPGMLIMEDLSDKGAISPSFVHGMTYPQVLAAMKEIAKLHAWSVTTSIDWRSKIASLEDREMMMRGFLAPVMAGFHKTKEQYPKEFGTVNDEKVQEIFSYETFAKIMTEHREFMDDVLIHGDYHMNNILFEKRPDGTLTDEVLAILDFQAVLKGSPAYDIARILSFCLNHQIRRDHYDDIVRAYYDEIKSIAGDKFKPTYDQLRGNVDRQFALSSMFIAASIPTINYVAIKSEGEQKKKDEAELLGRMIANFDDAVKILGI